jgi:hypothetical protein
LPSLNPKCFFWHARLWEMQQGKQNVKYKNWGWTQTKESK